MSAASRPQNPVPSSPTPPTLTPNPEFGHLATESQIARTVSRLESRGFEVVVVSTPEEARSEVLQLLPEHAEVFTSTSQTLDSLGISEAINTSGKFDAVRPKLMQLRKEGKDSELRKLGAAPDYVVGSVHAITEDGEVVVASGSGSQLAPYASGAGKVIWVVGSQKIVPDRQTAFRRIQEYSYPLEDARARQAYGVGSSISKILVFNRDRPGRTTIVLVRENLGF